MDEKKIAAAVRLLEKNGYVVRKLDETDYNVVEYKQIFDMPLKEFLGLNMPKAQATRIYNAVNIYNNLPFRFVGQLVSYSRFMFQGMPNFGRSSIKDLDRALAKYALHYEMNTKGWVPPAFEEKKEEPREPWVPPLSYTLDRIKETMPETRLPMGGTAKVFAMATNDWPHFSNDGERAMVLLATPPKRFTPVHWIKIGTDIREYPRGLTTEEFKTLMQEDWKDTPGEVMLASTFGNFHRIEYVKSVRKEVMEGGWDANHMALFARA